MRSMYIYLSCAIFLAASIIGCSGNGQQMTQPLTPGHNTGYETLPVYVSDMLGDTVSGGMGIMGMFSLHLDPSNSTGEMASLRSSALADVLEVVDITNFLQLAPCSNCAKLQSVSLNNDGNLVASIGIKHPFGPGDPFKPITGQNRGDLHVFNIEGYMISDSTGQNFSSLGETISNVPLVNADGYSGYLDEAIDDIYQTYGSIHPYITHFDDYSVGNFNPNNPMGFESVTDPPPSGNLIMAMGSDYDYQDYVFNFADDTSIDLTLAIGCTYAVSAAGKPNRFTPEYRVPQHNKKAASEIDVEIITNDLAAGNDMSTAELQISVVDINHGVAVGEALDEMRADSSVGGVTVEIPGVILGSVDFPATPISGTGHDPADPLIFQGTVTNSAAGDAGFYTGLVKVTDSYAPGLNESPLLETNDGIKRTDPIVNPLTGMFAITEFASYQSFEIEVGLGVNFEILTPNGGEKWLIDSMQDITWDPVGIPGTVYLEYSKDNFVADINPIAADEDNDGLYPWTVPDDKSETVRVRITSTTNVNVTDTSDEDFEIADFYIVFSDEGVLPEQEIGYDDISPALCVESDTEIKMAYNVNKVVANDRAYSFACASADGLNWYGFQRSFQSWGGVLANHGDSTKIIADNQGNSFRYLCLYHVVNQTWSTPFAAATEYFPSPWGIDGAHVTIYIDRSPEMIMDADEYVYVMGDRNNTLQFKKSEIPQHLTGGPSGAIWTNFPIYQIGQGYFSRARSIELAPNDNMYFVYYVTDAANEIRLAYNTDSTGLDWNTDTVAYDGDLTSTTGAHDPGMDITPDGEFHVTFIRESGANNQLCYIHSADGTTWTDPVVISEMAAVMNDDPICFYNFNSIDWLATVWQADSTIYITFSADGGITWADAVQVDSLLEENRQPDFVVTEDGIMHIAWAAYNGTDHDIHYRNAWIEN